MTIKDEIREAWEDKPMTKALDKIDGAQMLLEQEMNDEIHSNS